ncbi:MAG: LysR family transcriptional regulator [Gammaproteobacteria bacterium]|nr:LysR family transcriptional regulator [Gammaproteobacteria bacterium]MBU0848422.1 LysR family transcriptional regulator [Gammaproteobacteria bacterium]MBU1268175.1 LysR family transcriptional regulator [Gammaproteobacteria bacterium]MBU1780369.1 LysR family transcriptional regulator [Gammaproteobacteria bacterium]MBU2087979.1 LysR family transcriptional regulator [Gammaproteobacteria bacterium]
MNLHLLRIFVCAVEVNSFTKAADQLGISQPAVSKAVRELESQLDTLLLERRGKYFKPNEAGQVLFDYGKSLFAMEREASEVLRAFKNLERGRLIVGASTTVASYWLAPYLKKFSDKHPGVDVQVVGANTESVAQLLLDCKVDVALVEGAVNNERIETRLWRTEEMVAIAPSFENGIRKRELDQQVWILREQGSGSRNVAEQLLLNMGIQAQRTLEMNSNEAIIQAVAAGCGVGIVPKITARDQLALRRVKRFALGSGKMERPLFRLRLPHRPLANAALAFEALLGTNAT